MADNEGAFVLGKKAFVATLVAIAFSPIGIAVGYGASKWLQAPKLIAQNLIVDATKEGVTVPKELVFILARMDMSEDRSGLKEIVLSADVARSAIVNAQGIAANLTSEKQVVETNIAATLKWRRGEPLIVIPLQNWPSEAPQTVANRDKNELLGIYRSVLEDIKSQFEEIARLLDYLQAHPLSDRRTGEAVITVGVLNSGDSDGVVYPKAALRSEVGEIDLTARPTPNFYGTYRAGSYIGESGGYLVIPPHSFREATFVMDRSTRGDAAENWKKLVQSGRGSEVTVELQTSGGRFQAKGKLPL